jgi:hypothetical protein
MGKLKEFLATVVPVTDANGRELFPTSAAERKAIKERRDRLQQRQAEVTVMGDGSSWTKGT